LPGRSSRDGHILVSPAGEHDGQHHRYVDDPPRVDAARPFLVRGLGRDLAMCKWNITLSGGALVVHQGCLAKGDVPLKKQPVVVWLRGAPEDQGHPTPDHGRTAPERARSR
jgi:hypothetical protein